MVFVRPISDTEGREWHTVGAPAGPDGARPRRGYRRVEWIERALDPLRGTLPPERFERLVSR